jgi:hypothetical protein
MYDVGPRLRNAVGRPPMGPPRVPAAMNAPNPLMPQPRPLSESTLEQVRRAIQDRRQSPSVGDGDLRAALAVVAQEARERTIRPEELIVTLKQLIDDLPGARSSLAEERRLREWIVTTCIHAYFGDA